jgi:hypothetical protein
MEKLIRQQIEYAQELANQIFIGGTEEDLRADAILDALGFAELELKPIEAANIPALAFLQLCQEQAEEMKKGA